MIISTICDLFLICFTGFVLIKACKQKKYSAMLVLIFIEVSLINSIYMKYCSMNLLDEQIEPIEYIKKHITSIKLSQMGFPMIQFVFEVYIIKKVISALKLWRKN